MAGAGVRDAADARITGGGPSRRGLRPSRVIGPAAAAVVAVVALLLAVHVVVPQRSGPIALTEVFEPYLLAAGLMAALVAVVNLRRNVLLRVLVILLVIGALGRYVPAWLSVPPSAPGEQLNVMSWNLLSSPESGARALEGILRSDADLIGLQELLPQAADALAADPTLTARLPHSALAPERTVLGMGLLSRFAILEQQAWTDPPLLRAVVEPAPGELLTVFVVHPLPARIVGIGRVPVALDTAQRDADIEWIREQIVADVATGRGVIVMGDLNTTEREPAYAELAAGLRDAHLEAGIGPGFTWRPPALAGLPFGLLRIDYILAGPGFTPTSTFVDCGLRSDHCRLEATLIRD